MITIFSFIFFVGCIVRNILQVYAQQWTTCYKVSTAPIQCVPQHCFGVDQVSISSTFFVFLRKMKEKKSLETVKCRPWKEFLNWEKISYFNWTLKIEKINIYMYVIYNFFFNLSLFGVCVSKSLTRCFLQLFYWLDE